MATFGWPFALAKQPWKHCGSTRGRLAGVVVAPPIGKLLKMSFSDGRFPRLFRSLVKADLLILDDWGPDRLTAGQRRDLMEIVEDRHGRGSILITSQLPVTAWHDVIDEPTFADAILDRLVHNAYRLELDGHSMRRATDDPTEKVDEGHPA